MELPRQHALRVVETVAASQMLPLAAIPIATCSVSAGFPSPADDYVENGLDLHELLGVNVHHCYFVRVQGVSMSGARIQDGDIVLVNRALDPKTGSIVVACLDGEVVIKRFVKDKRGVRLLPDHPSYPPIEVGEDQDLVIWGVVTFSIHDHQMKRAISRVAKAA